ncbi:hypothetical protein D3C86_1634860 [compost metagenome]
MPAPSAPNAELKLAAKLWVALVASTVSSTVSVGSVPVVLMLGPSSSKMILEPISAFEIEAWTSVKPPISKSACSLPLALTAAPFSTSTRLWSDVVVYSIW